MRTCALLLLVLAAAAAAQDTFAAAPITPDAARDARVRALIEALRGIEEETDGITCWSGGGVGFAVTDDEAPPAFRELVRLGPAAIPALLDHLTDKRRTRLSFRHDPESPSLSSMFLLPEIPAGDSEELARIRRVLGVKAIKDGPFDLDLSDRITDYTVTVGDCCFTILGQIVNRSYEAVYAQPSAIFVVSSPTQIPGIAKVLRGRWGRADPRQLLAESLLADFRRKHLGAEERLALYFPDEAGPIVERRIAGLSWENDGDFNVLVRALRMGHPLARAKWLEALDPDGPKAVQRLALWVAPKDPGDDGRERIRKLLGRTMDAELLLRGLRALPREGLEEFLPRLEANLASAGRADRETRLTLAAMVCVDDDRSLPLFRAHMERFGAEGCETVLSALEEKPDSRIAQALLPPLLDVTAPVQNLPGLNDPAWVIGRDIRICDWAAHLLAETRSDLSFERYPPVEERDRQIAAMRAALAK